MALISNQVQELQRLLKRMDKGTITTQEIADRCKVHALIAKQENVALKVLAMSLLNGMSPRQLAAAGLMSKGEIIQVSALELSDELIECPDLNKTMTRGECLDYSGEVAHNTDCSSCLNFALTRKLLVPAA